MGKNSPLPSQWGKKIMAASVLLDWMPVQKVCFWRGESFE